MSPSAFNQWFLSLEIGRRDILLEDKWALASAAFEAGFLLAEEERRRDNNELP